LEVDDRKQDVYALAYDDSTNRQAPGGIVKDRDQGSFRQTRKDAQPLCFAEWEAIRRSEALVTASRINNVPS
jgi:hypothetical protein